MTTARQGLVKTYNGDKLAVYTIDAYKGIPKPLPTLLVYGLGDYTITRDQAAKTLREMRAA